MTSDADALRQTAREKLFALQDKGYRDFISRLIPTLDKARIIGVRSPAMGKLGKSFPEESGLRDYLALLPHYYFEENSLHSLAVSRLEDYDEALRYTRAFLPHIDNWATCDSFKPAALHRCPEAFYGELRQWLQRRETYTLRFAVVSLMGRYLDKHFKPEMLDLVCAVRSDEYYVNMALAWYLSEALVKQYALTLPFIASKALPKFTHNKAIQKAIESRALSAQKKEYLRGLRMR